MSSSESAGKTPQGFCTQCKQLNPYTVPQCQWCGARLPWAPNQPAPAAPPPPPQTPPPPAYGHAAQGYGAYSAPMARPKRSTGEYILIGCVVFLLLSIATCLFAPVAGVMGFVHMRRSELAAKTQPLPTTAAGTYTVDGPSFQDLDSRMLATSWTEAQKDTYWEGVKGKTISWTGEVVRINDEVLTIRCKPESSNADAIITLDDTQKDRLARLSVNQRITVVGTLQKRGFSSYIIHNGHILGL